MFILGGRKNCTHKTVAWEEIANTMAEGGKFFDDMGGYTLPKARS